MTSLRSRDGRSDVPADRGRPAAADRDRLARPGEQLRTTLELRERYEASRNTVRDAIKWLVTRGLVETRPGHGRFVPERIDPFVTPLSPTATNLETVFGVEGAAYGSEVMAQLRKPEIKARRGWRCSRPAPS